MNKPELGSYLMTYDNLLIDGDRAQVLHSKSVRPFDS